MSLLERNEQRKVEQLAKLLDKKEIEGNRTTLQELSAYQMLFKRTDVDEVDVDQLTRVSAQFVKRFNPYRPIEVLGPDGHVLFRIPQLFTPLSEIRKEYSSLVNRFHKDGKSDIPKYAAEATKGLMAAIVKSQQDGATEQGYGGYVEYIRTLNDEYRRDIERFNELKKVGLVDETADEEVKSSTPRRGSSKEDNVSIDSVDALSWD